MSAFVPAEGRGITVRFCIEGLGPREQMLVKSHMRLLDHLTLHHWLYYSSEKAARVDVLIVPHGFVSELRLESGNPHQLVLEVGANLPAPLSLRWPLRPCELEKELERLGDLVASQRAKSAGLAAVDTDKHTHHTNF